MVMYTSKGSFTMNDTKVQLFALLQFLSPSNEQICKTEAPAAQHVRLKMISEQEWQY